MERKSLPVLVGNVYNDDSWRVVIKETEGEMVGGEGGESLIQAGRCMGYYEEGKIT